MDNATDPPVNLNTAEPALLAQSLEHATTVMLNALPIARPDTALARAAREVNAIWQVAALVPVNAAETMMAVQFVLANAQGIACQRLAQDQDELPARRSIQLAATMMRVSHGAANVLLRLQAARQRREATPEGAASADMTEHGMRQMMLRSRENREAARLVAEKQAAEQAVAEAAARPLPPPPAPEPAPITEADIAAAEAYAQSNASNLNRARIMRRKAGMPNWGMFTPPEPNVIRAIAFGHSPFLDGLLPG